MHDASQESLLASPPEAPGPHLVVLAVCAFIVVAALVLDRSGDAIRIGSWSLPTVCTFRRTTGLPCPGCGLTRSIVAAAHGEWGVSFSYHRLGPIVLVYIVVQMLYRIAWLAVGSFRTAVSRVGRSIDLALIPLMLLILLNWIPTLLSALQMLR